MEKVNACLVCGSSNLAATAAMAAPFLARRVWDRWPFRVDLARCRDCAFLFFNPRMSAEEERRLYAGYRSDEYRGMRFACEPWYTQEFNARLNSPEVWRIRKEKLADVFREHFKEREIGSLLDFGGDRGDLIVDLVPGAERFVYDISGVEPLAGITALKDLDACRAREFDLILSSNVLEHVNYPRKVLGEIADVARPGTLVFVEVPFESPFSPFNLAKRLAQNGILLGTRPASGVRLMRPAAMVQMHEHVNFFNPRALEHLVRAMGWSLVASGVYALGIYKLGPVQVPSGQMTWCVARIG